MDPQERYDRFRSALGFRADLTDAAAGTPGLALAALDGEPIEPPVQLHVDAASLTEHLGAPADDDHEAARLQSLLAQIEEALLVREHGQDHLVLDAGGLRTATSAP
ncbi:hypothetical protein [Actinomycetospora sp. NBRC 106378]|jgi:hypothetical protein|uniref:hypothetical protein n=1 Tax=Actinomycetospora sp. NBRC 106378 TaxID=3032208 RepID=UPI0024A332C7|nr:hypothetical protein [Actinomycetospora sp. NBRC 106378]GLZ51401.1 hypothetical protein Acsp07_10180 [Actinomycetospora sp. NBRC 106378]